jgi:hypothetical protein
MNQEKSNSYLSKYYYDREINCKSSRSNSRSSFGAISNHESFEDEIILPISKKKHSFGSFQNIFENIQVGNSFKERNSRKSLGVRIESLFRRNSDLDDKNSTEKRKAFFGRLSSTSFKFSNSFSFTNVQNTDQTNKNFLNSITVEESDDEEDEEIQEKSQTRKSVSNILDILQNKRRIVYFKKFSKIEFSTENVEFWEDAEKFKKIEDPNERMNEAERISKMYLSSNSENEISISSRICKFISLLI